LQKEIILVLTILAACVCAYKEEPREYEHEGISHVDYEQDQMPIMIENYSAAQKVKRMVQPAYEAESEMQIADENNQTPAEDRKDWQVKPKPKSKTKRMSGKGKNKVHIFLRNEDPKPPKSKSRHQTSTSTTTMIPRNDIETQTNRAPEVTTKADRNLRTVETPPPREKHRSRDSVASGSEHSSSKDALPADSETEGTQFHDEIIKEKIKIKHHHHHHHHNHVKTVVKKDPYAVEKIVHVPVEKVVEKVVEKKVPYKVEVEKVRLSS